jgi:hypothetical protein
MCTIDMFYLNAQCFRFETQIRLTIVLDPDPRSSFVKRRLMVKVD